MKRILVKQYAIYGYQLFDDYDKKLSVKLLRVWIGHHEYIIRYVHKYKNYWEIT